MSLLLLLACAPTADSDSDTAAAPVTCTPNASSAWTGGAAFVDRTSEWGLDGVTGALMPAGDLDGDGWPDLLVTEVYSNAKDDPDAGVYYHRLLLNRPSDTGGRTFADATLDSGILTNRDGGVGQSGTVLSLGDADRDGDLDVFSGRYMSLTEYAEDATGLRSELYLNDGGGHFTIKADAGFWEEDPYPLMGAAWTDYDGDGNLDLWMSGWYEDYGKSYDAAQPRLWRGNGDGTFLEVTEDVGLKMKGVANTTQYLERGRRRPAMGNTACDVDGDALPDLLQSNYGRAWNFLFHNEGGTFVDIGEEAHFDADTNYDYSDNLYYECWCEYYGGCDPEPADSCAGDPATYAPYWTPGLDDQEARLAGNSFTTVCGDIDNDGDLDLYTSEIAHQWAGQSSDASQLLLNDGTGHFERIDNETNGLARPRPVINDWNEGDIWAAFVDFDNDGWQDLFVVTTDYPDTHMWLFRQVSPGQFLDVSDEAGMNQEWPYGIAAVDFDGDGDLDVLTGQSTARTGTPWTDHQVHFYENTLGGGNWLRVAGLPIGTRVVVEAGGLTQTQEVSGSYGRGGIQNDVPHFGLGDVCLVDGVTATLPGGATQTWGPLVGNQSVTLTFGQ